MSYPISFNLLGDGPYAGTLDGRILKYQKLTNSFMDFATATPTSVNKTPICGFPTGSSFDYTGRLFSCDITTGVTVVGPFGGLAKALLFPLKTECLSFSFLAWMLQENQNLYFADASGVFNFTTGAEAIRTGDSTGRLLEYNPKTKKVTTLLANLGGALGVATAAGASYVLVSEFIAKRIKRYWLKGEKAGTSEIIVVVLLDQIF
ncbi:unnamed protein product [Coffea canephora]|uniref:Strictosidine synthase conserved region domain-containing protein n=1 Tax=Coffea canephora TaxID=49390 RepID=A0A068TQG6_COFCA|nr:unnamed protein product [Coffea canephora]